MLSLGGDEVKATIKADVLPEDDDGRRRRDQQLMAASWLLGRTRTRDDNTHGFLQEELCVYPVCVCVRV